jgi:drug/metabolite transporter (DMT)-like permease
MSKSFTPPLEKPSIFKTIICLFTAAFMWGSSNVIARSLLIEGVNEIFLVTARVSIIGSLLFAYSLFFNREKFDKKLLKEEKISISKYIAIAVGFSGIAYLFISRETGLLEEGNIFVGGSLAFIGVQGIAFATVLNRKYAPKYKVSSWLTYQYPLVLTLSWAAFLISGVGIESLDPSQQLRLSVLVVFNLGAFMSFTWLIQRVSALLVATVDYLVPVVGVTAGVVFLNEVFNQNIIISGIFIFISLVISTREEFAN